MTVPLSHRTCEHIDALFSGEDRELVRRLIEDECGDNLPLWQEKTPEGLERIRFAVLKLSAGRLEQFDAWLREAQLDWRDCLVAAGFADDLKAHVEWNSPGELVERRSAQLAPAAAEDESRQVPQADARHTVGCIVIGVLFVLVGSAAVLMALDSPHSAVSFSAVEWRDANTSWSENAEYPRRALADGLIRTRALIGLPRVQTRAMLGEPNSKDFPALANAEDDHYHIGPERGWFSIDDEWLFLEFDAQDCVERAWIYTD